MVESHIGFTFPAVASAAIAPGLRLKWHATPGKVAIAGDEACIGIAWTRAFADGDPIEVLDIRAPGFHPFVAGGAIAAGAAFTSAAGGKVVTGAAGVEDYGVAITAATADGGQFMGTSAK
ncbi:MAG: hypothetical protein AB7G28_22755 [Pirellulales bacterium]